MNPSSVTTNESTACDTDIKPALQPYGKSSQEHCDSCQQHCETSQQHCETLLEPCLVNHAATHPSHLALENGPAKNSRFRWISLAAVSAAITVAVAPLALGAWQRSHKPTPEQHVDTALPLTNSTNNHTPPAKMESSNPEAIGTESPSQPDYVALREPTEDGERVRIVVLEPTRDIYIHESDSDGIQIRVRRYLFGTSTEQMVSAVDVQDLKAQSPEAFEIYQSHIGKAHFVGPAVSIYPAEEFVAMQPSGFLTATPLDSAKNADEKKSSAEKKTKENMKDPPKKNGVTKNMGEKSSASKNSSANISNKKDAKAEKSTAKISSTKNVNSTKMPRSPDNKNLMGKKATESKTKREPTTSNAKAKSNPDSSSKKNKLTSQKMTGKSQEKSKNQETSKNQGKSTNKTATSKKATASSKTAKPDKSASGKSEKNPKGTASKQSKSPKSDSAKSEGNSKSSSQKGMKNREPKQKNESSSKSTKPKVEATKKSAAQRFEDESLEIFQLAAELNSTDQKHPNCLSPQ
jgi:hypothetical protein